MTNRRRLFSVLAVLGLIAVGTFLHRATTVKASEGLSIARLEGNWRLSFAGVTGCGYGTQVSDFTLNASGVASIPAGASKYHTAGCGDGASNAPTEFLVQSLNPDGTGTGNLSCGAGCGWNLILQVSPDGKVMSFTDVDPVNPGNFISGTVIKKNSGDD